MQLVKLGIYSPPFGYQKPFHNNKRTFLPFFGKIWAEKAKRADGAGSLHK
jgi:hypothetical protein